MTAAAPRPTPPRTSGAGSGAGPAGAGSAVDAAVAGLAELADLPVAEHAARFAALHEALAGALAAVDGA